MIRRGIRYLAFVCLCVPIAGVQAGCGTPRLQVLENRAHSGVMATEPIFMVVSDRPQFIELHQKIHSVRRPLPPPPAIDFSQQRVVAVFMGERRTAGYAVSLDEEIRLHNGTAEVTVRFERPPPNAVLAQVITHPYAMAVLERGAYARVKFVDASGKVLETIEVD